MAIDAASRQLGRVFKLEFLNDLKALKKDKQEKNIDKVIVVANDIICNKSCSIEGSTKTKNDRTSARNSLK